MRVSVETVYNTALTDISMSLNAAGVVLCAYAGGVRPHCTLYIFTARPPWLLVLMNLLPLDLTSNTIPRLG